MNKQYMKNPFKPAAFGINGALYRLLLAWIISATIMLIHSPDSFTLSRFYSHISLPVMILMVLGIWILLLLIRNNKAIIICMVSVSTLYCILAVAEFESVFFAFGCCVFLAGIVLFSPIETISPQFTRRKVHITMLFLILVYTIWIGGVCCLAYLHHSTPNFDFGIFSQMFYYMKKTGLPLTTCERDRLLTHFAVHISPICYLLLPIYMIFPSPMTLQIAQVLLVASGIIPLALLCRKYRISGGATLLFCLIYLSYPAYVGGCFFYFHENNFLAPLLLWMFYAFESHSSIAMAVSALAVCMVKEDAPMYAAVLTLYFILRDYRERRKVRAQMTSAKKSQPSSFVKKAGDTLFSSLKIWIFIFCVIYFALVVSILARYGDGAMVSRYNNYIYDKSQSLLTMFKAIFQNPIFVLSQCFTNETLLSCFEIFIPLGFLPLFLSDWEELVLLIPYVLMNMMSSYYYQHVLGYQYYFGSCSFLFYLAVINYARNGQNPETRISAPRKKCLMIGVCASFVLTVCLWQGKLLDYLPGYILHTEEREQVSEILAMIPEEGSVAATSMLVPELTSRDEVYEVFYTRHYCDYVVIDLRTKENKDFYKEYSENQSYRLVKEIPHAAALFEKLPDPEFTSGNPED